MNKCKDIFSIQTNYAFLLQVIEEPVVKEEVVESDLEREEVERNFDYSSLVSDLGASGSSTEIKDDLDCYSSSYSHTAGDQPLDSQAGPSGLQGVSLGCITLEVFLSNCDGTNGMSDNWIKSHTGCDHKPSNKLIQNLIFNLNFTLQYIPLKSP